MLTVQMAPMGLGVFLEGKGPSLAFEHSGLDAWLGAAEARDVFPGTGQGAVVMTKRRSGFAARRRPHSRDRRGIQLAGPPADRGAPTVSLAPTEFVGLTGHL